MGLAECEIDRVNWANLTEATGSAERIGAALRELLAAATPEEASDVYWKLENHIVVQGELFEAAEASTSVLVAALADERPRHIRIAALELLFQILSGQPSESKQTPTRPDLADRCRARAREGLWLLIRELVVGERAAATDVLELLNEEERVKAFKECMGR
jgi:hypothetical protein